MMASDGIVAYVSPVHMGSLHRIDRFVAGYRYKLRMSRWTYPPDVDGDLTAKGYRFAGTLGFALSNPDPTTIPPGQVLVLMSERLSDRAEYEYTGDDYYGPSLYWSPPSGYQPPVMFCGAWATKTTLQEIAVQALEPNELTGGDKVTINWTSMRSDGLVEILYTVDDGANWTLIAEWIPVAQGAYEWTVPNINADKANILVRWAARPGNTPVAWAAGRAFKVSYTTYWPSFSLNLRPLFFEPPAPTGLLANGLGPTPQIRLFWEDNSGTETGFVIERRTGSGPYTALVTVPPDTVTYVDTTVAPDTLYTYRVKATGNYGDSDYSDEAAAVWHSALPADPGTPPGEDEPPPVEEPPVPVFDGSQSGWAEGELALAYQHGLTFPAIMNQFGRPITREGFCAIAVKLYEKLTGLTALPAVNPFNDTNNPEVLKAYALDIVRGVSATQFAPYNNITRQEMCVMIYRALKAAGKDMTPPPSGSFPFTDAGSIAPWAINEVRYCHHHQIMRGTSTITISPLLNTPREQAIVLVWRTYEGFR